MKMMILLSGGLIMFAMLTSNCDSLNNASSDSTYMDYNVKKVGYKLYDPDKKITFQSELDETSGLAYYNKNTLATIEDENGYVYLINSVNGKIERKIKFGKDGDYESVEVINNIAYVMESNGDLSYFLISEEGEVKSSKVDTEFSSKNNIEGLGYDGQNILVACKGSGDIDDNKVNGKAVYKLKTDSKKIIEKEAVDLSENDLDDFIKSRKYFNNVRDFDPSAIAVHPITSDIYLLSADKILVIFTSSYKIKEVIKLDPSIYRQPEGICFSPHGTLYISSEGAGGNGKLMELMYRP